MRRALGDPLQLNGTLAWRQALSLRAQRLRAEWRRVHPRQSLAGQEPTDDGADPSEPRVKGGFGDHPFGAWLDDTGEALAALLRPGNAGSNTAADHLTVVDC